MVGMRGAGDEKSIIQRLFAMRIIFGFTFHVLHSNSRFLTLYKLKSHKYTNTVQTLHSIAQFYDNKSFDIFLQGEAVILVEDYLKKRADNVLLKKRNRIQE